MPKSPQDIRKLLQSDRQQQKAKNPTTSIWKLMLMLWFDQQEKQKAHNPTTLIWKLVLQLDQQQK